MSERKRSPRANNTREISEILCDVCMEEYAEYYDDGAKETEPHFYCGECLNNE